MREAGLTLLVGLRQGDPGLDAVRRAALAARPLEALAVGDALARGHPVDLARPDRLLRADAVAMHDLAVEQVGDRREPDMRVRQDVQLVGDAGRQVDRPRSEEHTSELQSLMRISYAVFCLQKKQQMSINIRS